MKEDKILASVDGKIITQQDLKYVLGNLDPERAKQFDSEEGEKRLLDELINQELFYLDAVNNGYDQEEDFKKELEQMKIHLLKQYNLKKLFNQITVEEDEIINYYKENKDKFNTPARARASHILVSDKQKANKILVELSKGLSFEEAAKKYSTCPSRLNGGDLGYFREGQMVPEFEKAVFDMKIGGISQPVQSKFGYHIIKLVDKKDSESRSLEEVKQRVAGEIASNKQSELYKNKVKELKNKYEVKIN